MGKVISYFDYLNTRHYDTVTENTIVFVQLLYPKLEKVIQAEIAKMSLDSEEYSILTDNVGVSSSINETIIVSLCFLLAQYLKKLMQMPNSFNVTEDNFEMFIGDLLREMFNSIKKS